MTAYYNSAALEGGMSIADAFSAINGGWAFTPGKMWNGYQLYTLSKADRSGVLQVMQKVAKKFAINNNARTILSELIQAIFTYDTYLVQGKTSLAHDLKYAIIAQNPAVYEKLWTYLRNKMHKGTSTHEKTTKATRLAHKVAAAKRLASLRGYLARPSTNWVGSGPYSGVWYNVVPRYKGLASPWGLQHGRQIYGDVMSRRWRPAAAAAAAVPAAPVPVVPVVVPKSTGKKSRKTAQHVLDMEAHQIKRAKNTQALRDLKREAQNMLRRAEMPMTDVVTVVTQPPPPPPPPPPAPDVAPWAAAPAAPAAPAPLFVQAAADDDWGEAVDEPVDDL